MNLFSFRPLLDINKMTKIEKKAELIWIFLAPLYYIHLTDETVSRNNWRNETRDACVNCDNQYETSDKSSAISWTGLLVQTLM